MVLRGAAGISVGFDFGDKAVDDDTYGFGGFGEGADGFTDGEPGVLPGDAVCGRDSYSYGLVTIDPHDDIPFWSQG